jgi:methionine sulfoxide reductase heme-binding subunit
MTDALWYLGRGTGVVSLLLLTLVVALGVATRAGRPVPGLSRFATAALHRSASLLAVALLAVHVLTLLFDPYAQLSLLALVLPFTAGAQPFWYGLGAVALDLVAALVLTSLLRVRIGLRAWRGVHWLAYAAWPVALAHALGSGSDAGSGWMLGLVGGCVVAVLAALGLRVATRAAEAAPPLPASAAPRIGAVAR